MRCGNSIRCGERINHALADAAAIKIVSNSDRSELVAGEGFSVRAEVAHRADTRQFFSQAESDFAVRMEHHEAGREGRHGLISASRFPPGTDAARAGDWMYPFPPAMVSACHSRQVEGYTFDFASPVTSLHATTVSVLSYPLLTGSPIALTVEPEQYVVVETRSRSSLKSSRGCVHLRRRRPRSRWE